MERNNVGGSAYQIGMQRSSAAAAAAEARRRRKPALKRDKGMFKRKRTTIIRPSGFVPPPLPPYINPGMLTFLFSKKLQNSDVNQVGRTILPKHPAETHLPRLLENGSIMLRVIDMDSVDAWSFKFRYWANNQSRMYVFEGTGPFIKKHGLQMGDYMLMYMDIVNWTYVIRAVKATEVEGHANKAVTAVKENNAENMLNDADLGTLDIPCISTNFPEIEDLMDINFPEMEDHLLDTTSMNDGNYFSDILNSFSSLEDELMNNYYPTTQPAISFDNLSSEDLSQV